MQFAGGAVCGNYLRKCRKDATLVSLISLQPSMGEGLKKSTAVFDGGGECPIDVRVVHFRALQAA